MQAGQTMTKTAKFSELKLHSTYHCQHHWKADQERDCMEVTGAAVARQNQVQQILYEHLWIY